jgi:hypothetical protein
MTEIGVSSEVIQEYTPCDDLRNVHRTVGNRQPQSSDAMKNNIHYGAVNQTTYCSLSENNKTPFCQDKIQNASKGWGDSLVKTVINKQRQGTHWTISRSYERSVNERRTRNDRRMRTACAMAQGLREPHPIAMPDVKR